jgi:nucleoside-diphosphate-sugar epimerase
MPERYVATRMRVMVTGGTGYVGAYTVKALLDAGHDVHLLVRSRARIDETLAPLGVGPLTSTVGDMTDVSAVDTALDGCDAALHCAAVVSLSRDRAGEALAQNPAGTRTVLDAAIRRSLDPIVYVSSVSALFSPAGALVHRDTEVAAPKSSYARSKADAEHEARRRQAGGAPIVITYPAGVCGPAAGPLVGEIAASLRAMLQAGFVPMRDARASYVDVRDVAAVHAAVMRRGAGPRRFVCGGHVAAASEVASLLRSLTGRRLPVVPVPGGVWRGVGRAVDVARRALPWDTIFTEEAMMMATRWTGTDDGPTHRELGVTYRPLLVTIEASLRALYATGQLSANQLGALARPR